MKFFLLFVFCLIVIGCDSPGSFEHDNVHDPLSPKYKPYPIGHVTAKLISNKSIQVEWDGAKNISIDSILIERSGSVYQGDNYFKKVAVIPYTSERGSYNDSLTLHRYNYYEYRLSVLYGAKSSDYVTSNSIYYSPKKPDNLKYQEIDKTSILFSWESENDFPTPYWVACKERDSNSYTVLKQGYTDTSIVFTGLDTTKVYDMMVSIDDANSVNYSSKITISYGSGFVQNRLIKQVKDPYIVGDIAYLNNSKLIAAIYSDGNLELINSKTGNVERSLRLGYSFRNVDYQGYELAANRKGSILAVSMPDQSITIVSPNGEIIRSYDSAITSVPHTARMVAVTATGDTLIYESVDHKKLNLFRVSSGKFLAGIPIHYKYAGNDVNTRDISISPDGKYLAIATNDSVNIWQISPLRRVVNASIPPFVYLIHFSPEDTKLYIATVKSGFNKLCVLDFSPDRGLSNLKVVSFDQINDPTSIDALPNTRNVIVGIQDAGIPEIDLIDSITNKIIAAFKKKSDVLRTVTSSDGKHVLYSHPNDIESLKIETGWHIVVE